jgi:hypothetical protein
MSSQPVDVTLMPIDIGFDPRATGIAVYLPPDTRSVAYPDPEGAEVILRASHDRIRAALERAGYEVVVELPPDA